MLYKDSVTTIRFYRGKDSRVQRFFLIRGNARTLFCFINVKLLSYFTFYGGGCCNYDDGILPRAGRETKMKTCVYSCVRSSEHAVTLTV